MILIIINILQQFPDNASLHGNQINCLYDLRHHSPANLRCVQFGPHRESGCSSRKKKFFLKNWGVINPLYIMKDNKTTQLWEIIIEKNTTIIFEKYTIYT